MATSSHYGYVMDWVFDDWDTPAASKPDMKLFKMSVTKLVHTSYVTKQCADALYEANSGISYGNLSPTDNTAAIHCNDIGFWVDGSYNPPVYGESNSCGWIACAGISFGSGNEKFSITLNDDSCTCDWSIIS